MVAAIDARGTRRPPPPNMSAAEDVIDDKLCVDPVLRLTVRCFPPLSLPISAPLGIEPQIIRENARLLFLSALSSNNAKCEDILRPSDFDFRLARKSDIDRIRHCNINTLPENYSEDVS